MKKVKLLSSTLAMACMLTWLIGSTTSAGSTTPGSVNDPLVTKSYVDKKDGEIEASLEARIALLEEGGSQVVAPTVSGDVDMEALYEYIDTVIAQSGGTGLFVVVEATKGQQLICGASAEVILRAGSATVVSGVNGDGLADLTSGEDLSGGDVVPKQHHLLVSRDDGRGLLIDAEGTSYILVKGAYEIK